MANEENDDFNQRYEDNIDDGRPAKRGGRDYADAKALVSAPAMGLIVAGFLNLLLGIACFCFFVFGLETFVNKLEEAKAAENDPVRKMQHQQNIDKINEGKEASRVIYGGMSAVAALCGLVSIVGGICMKGLNVYFLAILGCVAAVIPVSGCCCGYLYSLPLGIWAFIVLFNPIVKRNF
jgi:hypothetical protein